MKACTWRDFPSSIYHRTTRVERAHKSNAIDFCSDLSIGHPQRLRCCGIFGSGSGSIVSLASETVARSKSARASGGLLRLVPSKSPMPQISCSESLSLHSAEIFRVEGCGRKAPCFGFAGVLLNWLL